MGPVYWVGADGNVWLKDAGGTRNMGAALMPGILPGRYAAAGGSGVATQIADPNPPPKPTSQAPPGGTGGPPPPVFNAAGASNTQRTIDEIPGLLQAALASEASTHANTVGGFDAAQQTQQGQYDTGTTTNQQNYDSNFMDSIRAGIKGLGGLMSLLRGTGAGGGTAENLARDTVGGVTANDIRGGADIQKENQGQLDTSLGTFLSDLRQKRTAADDTFVNNNRAITRDSNTQLQDLFGKMAGFFGDVGNTGAATDWMNRAGALTPDIAASSKTQVSPYDTTPVVVHAPNLTAFAPPTQPNVLAPPSDGQVGSGIFTMSDPRRRKDVAAPAVPVPAGA